MGEVLRGVKARDWLVAGVLTTLGVLLMIFDVTESDAEYARAVADGSATHLPDSHSLWLVPVFLGTTIPVLWWRRGVLPVTGIVLAVMVLHDLLFGWTTRCGAGLPVAFVLAFLGALAYDRTKAWLACGLGAVLCVAVLAVDATAGPGAIVLALPVLLVVFGVGRAARHRSTLNEQLAIRD
jgi:hypothetical protein